MKNIKFIAIFAMLIGIATTAIFVACEKINDINNEKNNKVQKAVVNPNTSPCCQVTCDKGNCKSFSPPCNCTCTFLGKPDCSGGGVSDIISMPEDIFDGRVHVSLNADFVEKVREDQEYLRSLNKNYADELANAMEAYVSLVETYGLELTTKEGLVAYYSIIEIENQYESLFTEEELLNLLSY